MGNLTIVALRVVIALSLAGSLVVQALLLPLIWIDLGEAGAETWEQVAFISIFAGAVLTMQVFAVCIWRLLTLVRRGAVFSHAAFRYVDVIIGAIATASALAFLLAVLLAPGGMAPGIVGLICGASLVLAGMVLLVVVMRRLLTQAIERENQVKALRSELDEMV
ncbi:DUF2975 domain-containing protein [Microbacterium sp.]|uniref:DUF2975 domain-containing protein n=1 Tax=Microbacterium sp. TaxID=51671 RepID=UPI0028116FB0|nr:DUF2975 domain-containing protein [Microbacterium sp.]